MKLTSRGPVFFRQQRVGEAGRPFTMFKFRTMQVNCDHRIHQQYVESFIQSNQPAASGTDAVFKLVDDPRVTPIGDFLRRSSLDELPQFWNVLRGEMSLVGPQAAAAVRGGALQAAGTAAVSSKRSPASPVSGRSRDAAGRRSMKWCGSTSATRGIVPCGPT